MGTATQVFYTAFDRAFHNLPSVVQSRMQARIDEIGSRLESYPHHRLVGSERFRVRVGDYRIIYSFSIAAGELHLLAVGHRREIYR